MTFEEFCARPEYSKPMDSREYARAVYAQVERDRVDAEQWRNLRVGDLESDGERWRVFCAIQRAARSDGDWGPRVRTSEYRAGIDGPADRNQKRYIHVERKPGDHCPDVPIVDDLQPGRAEYEQLKADAEKWRVLQQEQSSNTPRLCTNCKFLRKQDEGYSAWTVLGYQADCMFSLNSFNSEQEDNHDRCNKFAAECEHYTEGPCLEIRMGDGEPHVSIRDWIRLALKDGAS